MKNIRAISLLICLVCLAISCKKQDAPPAPTPPVTPPVVPPVVIIPPAEYPGYSLLWNDEFNDTYINTQNWSYETGTGVNGDFGTGQLDRATDRKENVRIENAVAGASGGCLAIKTLKENYIDRNYTSARLSTSGKGSWGARQPHRSKNMGT